MLVAANSADSASAANNPGKIDPEKIPYKYHIIAVDHLGSAMEPVVRFDKGTAHVELRPWVTEDTTNRNLRPELYRKEYLACLLGHMRDEVLHPGSMTSAELGPEEGLFEHYRRLRAAGQVDRMVIYIHGGLNFIKQSGPFPGSTEKAVALTPLLLNQKIYPIFICWSSNLFGTYLENLLTVREGLRQPGRALPLLLFNCWRISAAQP